MSGISQYFHGERGKVTDLFWVAGEDSLTYVMSLRNDPHRRTAYDYGSDIGIDPRIRPGDQVVYLRADQYSGIWVLPEDQYYPEFDPAFDRVIKNREHMEEYSKLIKEPRARVQRCLNSLIKQTAVPVRHRVPSEQFSEKDSVPATVFLSFRSKNILIARALREFLSWEGKMEVWFGPEHEKEVPSGPERKKEKERLLHKWLQESVSKCQIFVLLLTREVLHSEYVLTEIDSAKEKTTTDEDFHLVVLKIEDVPLHDLADAAKYIVDCSGLSSGEILEELYASVHRRQGRRDWLEEQRRRGWPGYEEPATGYDHLESDAGRAIALHWFKRKGVIRWELDYESDGLAKTAQGEGEKQIVDPGICAGDEIGFFKFSIQDPLPIWMRSSEDLKLRPNDVINAYGHKLRQMSSDTTADRQMSADTTPNLPLIPSVLLACIGHTTPFFLVVALGLLVGRFTFAPYAPWWMIIAAWVVGVFTSKIFENVVFRKIVKEPANTWWRTRVGLSVSLLMSTVAFATGIAFVAHISGWRGISLMVLFGSFMAILLVTNTVGYILDTLHSNRSRRG